MRKSSIKAPPQYISVFCHPASPVLTCVLSSCLSLFISTLCTSNCPLKSLLFACSAFSSVNTVSSTFEKDSDISCSVTVVSRNTGDLPVFGSGGLLVSKSTIFVSMVVFLTSLDSLVLLTSDMLSS